MLLDSINSELSNIIRSEMDSKLESKRIGSNPTCKHRQKPWWSNKLSILWRDTKKAEKAWIKETNISAKKQAKVFYIQKQKLLDREIQ